MREEWEYKKLGEVCEHKEQILRAAKLFTPNEKIDYIDISSIDNRLNIISSTTPFVFCEAPSRAQQKVEKGDILISLVRPNLKNIAVILSDDNKLVASSGFCVLRSNITINNRYIFYIVRGVKFTNYLLARVQGANYPAVREDDIKGFPIPVPPLSEQQRIVSELDLLSSIIEKKKAQLKEYDQLAQSIFYDMFGDPVENEKGWEVFELSAICDVRDGTHDSPKYVEIGYPLITSKNVINGTISFDNVNYISENDLNAINLRSKVDDGDIIMPMIGTIGNPVVVHKSREFAIKNVALIKFSESKLVINIYIQKLLNSDIYSNFIKEQNRGGTQKFVSLKAIRQLPIPIPPLTLQQSFASKIEAIERQKALIQQSITETETLFNSRMDYWFS